MRKLLISASALALALAAPVAAQQVATELAPTSISEYVVKEGDNLWDLSALRLGNPEEWRWLVQQNPILADPSRNYTRPDGTTVVRIYPGEFLYGLAEVGIMPTAATTPVLTVNPPHSVPTVVTEGGLNDWDWAWWLLLIPGAAFAWWLFQRRESRKDPVYSGRPQVPGGIATAEQARERFAASSRFSQQFDIIDTVAGYISGTMMVRYGDNTEKPRVLNRQRAFQATIRLQNGQTENVYMLQQCGNDLRFGGVSRYLPGPGFNFEPDPTPEPAPIMEPVADPPSEEAAPPAAEQEAASGDETGPELKIELKPAEKEGDAALVRVTGAPTEDLVMTIGPDSFTLRFHPPKR